MSPLSTRIQYIKQSPTISVSTRAQEMKAAGRDVINLGSGEPDFDTPMHIKEAAKKAIDKGQTKYTAVAGTPSLKQAVVNKFQQENQLTYATNQVIISSGAKQSIMNLLFAILDDGDEVIIPAPYWVSYPDMVRLAGGRSVIVNTGDNYRLSPARLDAALSEKTKAVIFNSPSNPSGTLYSADEWRAFADVLIKAPRVIVISDDIYEHIRYDGLPFTNLLNISPDLSERTVLINGVSKAYAMTGWRIGYAVGPEVIVRAMTKAQSQSTSNPCSIAQAAAQAALDGGLDCVTPMLTAFDRRRRYVTDSLNSIDGIHCCNIEGAFYAFADAREAIAALAADETIKTASDLYFCEYLLETAEVATVPGSAFGYEGYFRLSFATSDDHLKTAIARLVAALKSKQC